MIQNPSSFIFSDKASCCKEHFSWSLDTCMGGIGGTNIAYGDGISTAVVGGGSGDKYYADWTSGDDTCKNDALAPEYMINVPAIWLYDDLDSCCEQAFSYRLDYCKAGGTESSGTGSNKYYVDFNSWKCVRDCAVGSGAECGGFSDRDWNDEVFDGKDSCCAKYVSWNYKECMNVN